MRERGRERKCRWLNNFDAPQSRWIWTGKQRWVTMSYLIVQIPLPGPDKAIGRRCGREGWLPVAREKKAVGWTILMTSLSWRYGLPPPHCFWYHEVSHSTDSSDWAQDHSKESLCMGVFGHKKQSRLSPPESPLKLPRLASHLTAYNVNLVRYTLPP